MKKIIERRVSDRERHVRWNFEQSEANPEYVRYHVVVVDDKDREGTLMTVMAQLNAVSSGVDIVRTCEGKVEGTRFRYLFRSFDSPVSPEGISWGRLAKPIKKDKALRERKMGKIESYVERLYSK